MTITKVNFALCPARFQVLYTDDNGEDKYAYAFAMGICYTCNIRNKEREENDSN